MLLPCERATFEVLDNRFYNALIIKLLYNMYAFKIYLQFYWLIFTNIPRCGEGIMRGLQKDFSNRKGEC